MHKKETINIFLWEDQRAHLKREIITFQIGYRTQITIQETGQPIMFGLLYLNMCLLKRILSRRDYYSWKSTISLMHGHVDVSSRLFENVDYLLLFEPQFHSHLWLHNRVRNKDYRYNYKISFDESSPFCLIKM